MPSRGATTRLCGWCERPIPERARADARTCSKACRQARSRFRIERGVPAAAATDRFRRFGYADPPYPRKARRYYRCREVDHHELVLQLIREFPDGWALSTSSDALWDVFRLCPRGTRVCPWVRGSRPGTVYGTRNAWEPLLVFGGRPVKRSCHAGVDDVLLLNARARQRNYPGALVGMKPPKFSEWMFNQLGARAGDELVDIFNGSGAVKRAARMFGLRVAG